MKTKCTCGQLNKTMSAYCENCGRSMDESSQFSKKSENGKYSGIVVQGSRGYFITITDGEVSHHFKQREVRSLEAKTKLQRQELADLVASKTKAVSFHYNGKYGQSSIQYDLRTPQEIEERQKEIAKLRAEEEIKQKKREEEKQLKMQKLKENPIAFGLSVGIAADGTEKKLIGSIYCVGRNFKSLTDFYTQNQTDAMLEKEAFYQVYNAIQQILIRAKNNLYKNLKPFEINYTIEGQPWSDVIDWATSVEQQYMQG